MNIILFGPPGAGKGTQSKYLVNKLKAFQISTGDLLREEIKRNSDIGKAITNDMKNGKFINDEIDNSWLEADIEQAFKDWYKTQDHNSQKDITRDGKTEKKWIAYIIAKRVLNDTNGLLREIGLSDDEEELLEISWQTDIYMI